MVVSDLYAAGCPIGSAADAVSRLADRATRPHARIEEALPYLRHIQNTCSFWGVRIILRELYGWIGADRQSQLEEARRPDPRAGRRPELGRTRCSTAHGSNAPGPSLPGAAMATDDDRLQYALEWGFFTRCQWGEFDTALYELERCWGKSPESPAPIGAGPRPATERTIKRLDDVHRGGRPLCRRASRTVASSRRQRISRPTSTTAASPMTRWPRRSRGAIRPGRLERDCYASYVNEAVPDRPWRPMRGRDRLSVQLRRRAAAVRDGQPAVAADDRPGRRDDRPAPQAVVPVLPGEPARQPVDVHAGARVAELQPGGLLVAQLLSRRRSPRSCASGSRWCRRTSRSGSFPTLTASSGRLPRRSIVRKILAKVLAERIELGQLDPGEALEFARADPVSRAAVAAGDGSACTHEGTQRESKDEVPSMETARIAQIIDEMGTLLEIKGENPFRCRAYHTAAQSLGRTCPADLREMIADGSLKEVPGIGETMYAKIVQLATTGQLAVL